MDEMRNGLLMELIDQMQGRLAEKAYPTEKKEEEVVPEAKVEEKPAEVDAEEPSDEELSEMMKEME